MWRSPGRIGLVPVITTEGDVFGPGVNLTARISAAADPSEVLIDQKAAQILEHLPEYSVVPQQSFTARGLGTIAPARLRYANDPRP